jgi:hypothetical protein
MAEFYKQAASNSSNLLSMVAHVNKDAIHNHPRVVTPPEESSANNKLAPGSASSVSAPVSRNSSSNSAVEQSSPIQTAKPASTAIKKARAIYDFPAQDATELPFRANGTRPNVEIVFGYSSATL